MLVDSPQMREKLETQVLERTGRRVRNLDIELSADKVVLHGDAATFYVKQLAQHSIREVLPQVQLFNAIRVS